MTPKFIMVDTPKNITTNEILPIQMLAVFRVSNINQNFIDVYSRSEKSIFDPISNVVFQI